MEFRPTFYSISGFLIPGVIFVAAIVLEIKKSREWLIEQIRSNATATGDSTAAGIILTTTVIAVALSACFVIGSVVSELYQLIYKKIRRTKCQFLNKLLFVDSKYDSIHESTRARAESLLKKNSLSELLDGDLDARETYAYQQTCGLDLHWFAGRNRMVGGSGLAATGAGILAFCLSLPFKVGAILVLVGLVSMWVAAYRMKRFEEYVTTTAIVSLKCPSVPKTADSND
jgi:hypothetical protein